MLIDLQVSWEAVGDCGGFLLFGFALLFCHSFGRGNRKRKESGKKIENQKIYQKLFWDIGCWDWPSRAFWSLGGNFFFFFLSLFFWVFWRIYYYRLITMGAITTASPQSLRSLQPPRSLQPLQSLQSKPGLSLPDLSLSTYYYGEYHYPSLSLRNHYLYGVHYHRSHHYPAPYYYGFLYLVGHPVIFLVTFGKT